MVEGGSGGVGSAGCTVSGAVVESGGVRDADRGVEDCGVVMW